MSAEKDNHLAVKKPSPLVTSVPEDPFQPKSRLVTSVAHVGSTDQQRYQLIKGWRPKSDTFFLRHGDKAAALMGAGIAVPFVRDILRYHRIRGLAISVTGAISTANMFFPAAMCLIAHRYSIYEHVVISYPPCVVCRQLRAVTYQMGFGVLFSTTVSLLSAKYLIDVYASSWSRMDKTQSTLQWMLRTVRRNQGTLLFAAALQAVGIAAVHYFEESEWASISEKLANKAAAEKAAQALNNSKEKLSSQPK